MTVATMTAADRKTSAYQAELEYRDELATELRRAMQIQERGGLVNAQWMADRIDALRYSNRKLELIASA